MTIKCETYSKEKTILNSLFLILKTALFQNCKTRSIKYKLKNQFILIGIVVLF